MDAETISMNNLSKESKLMVRLIMGSLVVAVLVIWAIPLVSRHVAIDRCLDAGGAYDYDTSQCNFQHAAGENGALTHMNAGRRVTRASEGK